MHARTVLSVAVSSFLPAHFTYRSKEEILIEIMTEFIEGNVVIQTNDFDFHERTYMDSVIPIAEGLPEVLMDGDDTFDVDTFLNLPPPLRPEQEMFTENKNIVLFQPISPLGKPSKVQYPGRYNFQARMHGGDTPKSKLQYSSKLDRMYINIDTTFAMNFKWNFDEIKGPLFIRATPVFTDERHSFKKITACLQHCIGDETIRHHFICSSENGGGIYYCGNRNNPESWLSVAVRFPDHLEPGVDCFSHVYYFRCMSSCCTGVKRRPIAVAFTLENANGEVLGRQMQSVCVSTSPGRDCTNYEKAVTKPRMTKKRCRGTSPKTEKSIKRTKMETPPTLLPPTVGGADIFQLPSLLETINDTWTSLISVTLAGQVFQSYSEKTDLYVYTVLTLICDIPEGRFREMNIEVAGVEDYKKILDYMVTVLKARLFEQADVAAVKDVCLRGIDVCERACKVAEEQAKGTS